MQNRVDTNSTNTNAEISNKNRNSESFDSMNPTVGSNKEANEFGTNTEKNLSRNHTGKPSDNKNTQKLQQNANDLKNHSQDMKSQAEYEKGANDDLGEDARRSRQDAETFQKNHAH